MLILFRSPPHSLKNIPISTFSTTTTNKRTKEYSLKKQTTPTNYYKSRCKQNIGDKKTTLHLPSYSFARTPEI